METDLDVLCGRLSLSEKEKEGIHISEGEVTVGKTKLARCLVGKLGTEKRINREAFRSLLTRLWKPKGSVEFKEVQDHLWIFEFSDVLDKDKVLQGRPWQFDRYLLILHEFDGVTPPAQIVFSHSPFWIQLHGMPPICMNREVGTKIGSSLGEVMEVDVAGDGVEWGRNLRIRVLIDVSQPWNVAVLLFGRKSTWVSFKYEKLPLFCFHCGRILHGPRGCPSHRKDKEQLQ
ncbi:hypothetical protein SLA2020_420210 [Shorea laevis]